MKTEQAKELVGQVSQLVKAMLDKAAVENAKKQKDFGIRRDPDAEQVQSAIAGTAVLLLGGIAVNIARIADALENPRQREKL